MCDTDPYPARVFTIFERYTRYFTEYVPSILTGVVSTGMVYVPSRVVVVDEMIEYVPDMVVV